MYYANDAFGTANSHIIEARPSGPVPAFRNDETSIRNPVFVNQHQTCGYSDSPFARLHCYTVGFRNGMEGVVDRGRHGVYTQNQQSTINSKQHITNTIVFESRLQQNRGFYFSGTWKNEVFPLEAACMSNSPCFDTFSARNHPIRTFRTPGTWPCQEPFTWRRSAPESRDQVGC